MNRALYANLVIVSLVHAGLIIMLAGSLLLPGCASTPKTERIIPLELTVEVPPGTDDGTDDFDPAELSAPIPINDPTPIETAPSAPNNANAPEPSRRQTPAKTTGGKTPAKKAIAKHQPPPIERSARRVKNPFGRPGARIPKKILSAAEIKRYLAAGARIGDHTTEIDEETLYLEMVRHILYEAWDQPQAADTAGRRARVEIELGPGGQLRNGTLVAGSGNRLMDDSVMRAVRAVPRIPDLPPTFIARHGRIKVTFELTDGM